MSISALRDMCCTGAVTATASQDLSPYLMLTMETGMQTLHTTPRSAWAPTSAPAASSSGIPALGATRLRPVSRKAPGLHLIGDLHGCRCDARLMHDGAYLQQFCQQAVQDAGLTAVGALFHSFGEGAGVTGVMVLAESHLSIHTWPEDGYVTLDVYVCSYCSDNSASAQKLFDTVMAAFAPTEPHLHRVERA